MSHLPDRLTRPITFMLVEPREGGNAGMVARAMANFGLSRLILVGADHLPDATDQVTARAEGRSIFERVRRAPDLGSALAPFHVAVAVTRRRGKHRPSDLGPFDLRELFAALPPEAEVAFVFGRESDGLRAGEVAQCGRLLAIPTSDDAPSLNLAQAAGIVAFSLFSAGLTGAGESSAAALSGSDESGAVPGPTRANESGAAGEAGDPDDAPVTLAELEELLSSLEVSLSTIGFLQGDRGPDTMISLRRVLGRAILTRREIRVFLSLARKIGRVAPRPHHDPAEPGA